MKIFSFKVLSENQLFPVTVCNACYGKAQESFQFIGKINETQNKFENEVCWGKESNKVDVPVKSRELTEHILQKIKKYSAVSIQKLNPVEVVDVGISVKTEPIDSLDYLVEVDESGEMVNISSDSESSDSNHEADSDFEYRPHKKLKDEEKLKSKAQKMNKNFFIDAPINFTCAKCKTSFDDFCTLSRHMKQRACQSLAEIFECEICKKQFNIKRKLREHMRSHQPKLTVMCDGCGISFKSQAELDSHSEAIHRRVVKLNCTFRCAHCPETFNSHLDLLEHIKSHPKNPKGPPKLCEICAKECPSTESYRVHMIKHQDVLPYICDVSKNYNIRYKVFFLIIGLYSTGLQQRIRKEISPHPTCSCTHRNQTLQMQCL